MPLESGARFGPYEIVGMIGGGGMGEVYKARDLRLNRTVAIKVLRPEFADRQGWKQRFAREAQTIASLNHPHICALHDIGDHNGTAYLVMEYLEGETLADRLARGPLATEDFFTMAIEICDALEQAHKGGVVHRDLKPSNVMITKTGVKLLDFGLSKTQPLRSFSPQPAQGSTNDATVDAAIVGTPQYMSPEQLHGKEVDARTDIFVLGEILYEMLTGKRTFEAESHVGLLAAILEHEPKPISTVRLGVPPPLEHLIETCLAKDPEKRWQSVYDISLQLSWIANLPLESTREVQRSKHRRRDWLLRGVAGLSLVVAIVFGVIAAFKTNTATNKNLTQFMIQPPDQTTFPAFRGGIIGGNVPALSPDGRKLALTLSDAAGKSTLWVRRLDSTAAQQLPGREDAAFPFWSPDNDSIGFFSEGKLKRIDATGGSLQVVCDAALPRGGTWNQFGVILFAAGRNPLFKVAATGGEPTAVTKLDLKHGETSQRWPYFLPDGDHFVYWSPGTGSNHSEIHLASLASTETSLLFLTDSNAVYSPTVQLLYIRQNKLFAQPFDVSRGRINGEPLRVADEVAYSPDGTVGEFSVSSDGTLAYRKGGNNDTQLVWYSRGGKELGLPLVSGKEYLQVNLSPDEKQAVVHVANGLDHTAELWLIDVLRGIPSRFTFGSNDADPIWSSDGERIVFTSRRDHGQANLYWKSINGTANEELLLDTGAMTTASDWSKDGKYILYVSGPEPGKQDVYAMPLFGDRKPFPVVNSRFNKGGVRFSPDQRWVAFHSNNTGMMEVYVTTFPASEKVWQISNGGGAQSHWRADGKELFFLTLDGKLMSVDIGGGPDLNPSVAKLLFQSRVLVQHQIDQYAVSADGQRFLMITPIRRSETDPVTVVLNWNSTP